MGDVIGQRPVNQAFVGNSEVAEMLGVLRSNARKTLLRYGVEGQVVRQGQREVHIYFRDDVERVVREMQAKREKDQNGTAP